MPRISRIRKEIRSSHWFTKPITLGASPLASLKRTGGLKNLNNVCYINSCIQGLLHCEPFVRVMLQNQHHEKSSEEFCALCAMIRISRDMFEKNMEVGNANELSSHCDKLKKSFKMGVQEDAHEFLVSLLEKLRTEEKQGCGATEDSAKDRMEETKMTLIDQLFKTRTKRTITCVKCGTKKEKEEPCDQLLLRPTKENKEKIKTVDEAMKYYFGYEVLEGNNAYQCENCDELVKAIQSYSLMEGPNVLVIGLARFSVAVDEENGPMLEKTSHFVRFPERLDVTPYMDDMTPEEELQLGTHQYRLSSFVTHHGEDLTEGHYVANVFLPSKTSTGQAGSWWKKDDSSVSHVGFEKDASVYLLFYTREDLLPRGLIGPRKKIKSKKNKPMNNEIGSNKVRRESSIRPAIAAKGDPEPKRAARRVFLFPKLDMVRRPKWYYSDGIEKDAEDTIFLTTEEFNKTGLTIESDDEIELLYDEDST